MAVPLLLALALPALAAEEAGDPAADQAAQAWLALIDHGKYATAWDQAGELLRKNIAKAEFEKRLAKVAETTGPATQRNLVRSLELKNPPEAPPGKYLVLLYAPLFIKQPKLIEQVAMSQNADKQWKVVGYYLR
ncbi:MAG: DUF4019 domain-containing protein [Desulfarculaceae bacterium]|nr:DUF4019 domain-containing protein [Desulfarculaceae bacterium]